MANIEPTSTTEIIVKIRNDNGKEKYFVIRFLNKIGKTKTSMYIIAVILTNMPLPSDVNIGLNTSRKNDTNKIPAQPIISAAVQSVFNIIFCLLKFFLL